MFEIVFDTYFEKLMRDGTFVSVPITKGNVVTLVAENEQPFSNDGIWTKILTWSGSVGYIRPNHIKQVD